MSVVRLVLPLVAILLLGAADWAPFGFEDPDTSLRASRIGDAVKGRRSFNEFGCGTCHRIRGRGDARGLVGPPLDSIGQRIYIAGALRNTPANMVRWLRHPDEIEPDTVMPDLGLSEEQARDITAYLYTLD